MAQYGNNSAEKYDIDKATELFKEAVVLSKKKVKRKVNNEFIECYEFDFIGEIAMELGTYIDIFYHLLKRFPQLQKYKNELDSNIQSCCYSNTKKGAIREATGIVNLKSNWKWTDRAETQNINHNTNIDLDINKLSLEEQTAISAASRKLRNVNQITD